LVAIIADPGGRVFVIDPKKKTRGHVNLFIDIEKGCIEDLYSYLIDLRLA